MNIFDLYIITYFNQFSQKLWAFDKTVSFLADSHLVKGLLELLE